MVVSSHAYISELRARGASTGLIRQVQRIDIDCSASGVLPIYTLGHLAFLARVPYKRLRSAIADTAAEYKEFSIAKKRGRGVRVIRVPSPDLKRVQQFILANCLPRPASVISHAYTRGTGILDAAACHQGARSVIMLDLSRFFDSVDSVSIYHIFLNLGYPELLSLELSLLCTYGGHVGIEINGGKHPYVTQGRRFLPQGAPSSGMLSNLALEDLDLSMQQLFRDGFSVTRYADDITISTSEVLSRDECNALIRRVGELCRERGFSLNPSKTKVLLNKQSYRILGLSVSSNGVGLTRPYKRGFESEVRAISTHGLAAHAAHKGYQSQLDYIAHLWGHIAYAKGIDFYWSSRMEQQLVKEGVPYMNVVSVGQE